MQLSGKHGTRLAVSLLPLVFALLHTLGVLPLPLLQRLDDAIYDARLRMTMPRTAEPRIVIVDVDEKSLAEVGRWPWPRHQVARLVDTLFEQQHIAALGFDTVFAEPDASPDLEALKALLQGSPAADIALVQRIEQLRPQLDPDARLARALQGRPVVLGYYFTSDRDGRTSGALPAPATAPQTLQGRRPRLTQWDGYGANLPMLAAAAPRAGFFNAVSDRDGVVRSLPLLAEHGGHIYESLSLAMFRLLLGDPPVQPGYPAGRLAANDAQELESVRLVRDGASLAIPVDGRGAALVPFRGPGGPRGGSFTYHPAADVLAGRLAPGALAGAIVLVGTTAPGLLDMRATPVGETYPGVETHANLLAGLLDGGLKARPDYAPGYELVLLLATGLTLALLLPLLPAARAVLLSAAVVLAALGLNTWLYLAHDLVLPLASTLVLAALTFALNMSYGYFVESRAKRELAQLFGTYVPPELVDEMVKDPDRYSMAATTREMTVLFCDMRGFTRLSETMDPARLQALLNTVFSRLTAIIRQERGTIDKYMGDCVMAFWGAPLQAPDHARLAVNAALAMVQAVQLLNQEHRRLGLPAIGVGIGLNTGAMCVGDMGSDVRRSYTVIGDAVNLGSRLEGLSRLYGVDIVASDSTRAQAPEFVWQELDRVRVKGKAQAVTVFTPLDPAAASAAGQDEELRLWEAFLQAWRRQDQAACETNLRQLQALNAEKVLYRVWAERVASMQQSPPGPGWDGATTLETK